MGCSQAWGRTPPGGPGPEEAPRHGNRRHTASDCGDGDREGQIRTRGVRCLIIHTYTRGVWENIDTVNNMAILYPFRDNKYRVSRYSTYRNIVIVSNRDNIVLPRLWRFEPLVHTQACAHTHTHRLTVSWCVPGWGWASPRSPLTDICGRGGTASPRRPAEGRGTPRGWSRDSRLDSAPWGWRRDWPRPPPSPRERCRRCSPPPWGRGCGQGQPACPPPQGRGLSWGWGRG